MMDDQNVFLTLNDGQSMQDGEEMVVIADEGMDMNTLKSLLASGAVQTLSNDDEIIQVTGDAGLISDTIVQLEGESYHVISDENGQTYLAPANQTSLGGGHQSGSITVAQTIDNSGITYRCPSCPQSYQNANAFTKHMREKHFVKVYTCRQCEQFYETLSQLFLHARRTHVDPKKPKKNPGNYKFHCPDCNYMTNNGGTMEHHRRAHTGVKPFSCDICGKHFAQKANMKTHKNRHIHKDRIFRCETCGKAFNSYDIYLAHLRTREHELREHFQMIASSKLILGCMGCNNTFDSMFNLNKHTRSCGILKQMDTKFCCKSCESYFNDIMTLKSHVKSHEGNQIISCPVCGERGFPGFNQLNHHITRAHALKVNRRHVCRYCESTFESKKDLDGHISDMHSEERNARQSRGAVGRLRCRYTNCDFTSNSVMLMDRHHRQHTLQGTNGNFALTLPQSRYSKYNKRRKIREAKKLDDFDDSELLDEEIERVNASLEANEILRYPTLLNDDDDEDDVDDDDEDDVDDGDEEDDMDDDGMRREGRLGSTGGRGRVGRRGEENIEDDDEEAGEDEDDELISKDDEHQQHHRHHHHRDEVNDMQQLADSLNLSADNLLPIRSKIDMLHKKSTNLTTTATRPSSTTTTPQSLFPPVKSENVLKVPKTTSIIRGGGGGVTGSGGGAGGGALVKPSSRQTNKFDNSLIFNSSSNSQQNVIVTSSRSRKKPWWYKDYDTTDMMLDDETVVRQPVRKPFDANDALINSNNDNEEWNIDM